MCRRSCCREQEIVRYVARPPQSNNYRQDKYQQKSTVCGKADWLAHDTKSNLPRYLCHRADVSRLVQEAKRLRQGIVSLVVDSSAKLTDMVDEHWDSRYLSVGEECIGISCHWDSRFGDKEASPNAVSKDFAGHQLQGAQLLVFPAFSLIPCQKDATCQAARCYPLTLLFCICMESSHNIPQGRSEAQSQSICS